MNNHRWLRLYHALLDNAKVQSLPDKLFKQWINTLCIIKRNHGAMPPLEEYAFALRMPPNQAQKTLDELIEKHLLDVTDGVTVPHNWELWQYEVTPGAKRQKRYRDRHASVTRDVESASLERHSVTPSSLSVSVSDSVSDSEEEKKGDEPVKRETQEFLDEQWKTFRAAAEGRGVLRGGDMDWNWAFQAWRVLDYTQKTRAITDVQERPAESPELDKTLPQNYLKGRKWERPMPPRRDRLYGGNVNSSTLRAAQLAFGGDDK